jgi:cell division protein FtsB
MRWLTLVLVALIAALQYPLWLGKGSWLRVWQVDQEVAQQKETNQKLKDRNSSMDAEVRDLKQGYDAIEERARSELGMIKDNEVFFQILEDKNTNAVKPSFPSPQTKPMTTTKPDPGLPQKDAEVPNH